MESSFSALVKKRVSCRSYRTEPVPESAVSAMLEAVRLAPSACNRQPWRLVLVTSEVCRREMAENGFLPGISMRWAAQAPLLIVLGLRRSVITHKLASMISGVDYAELDVGIAGEHLVLQATELGLGTCWIGWIRPKIIRKLVGWPSEIEPQAVIAVGYPAGEDAGRSRSRLEISEIAKRIRDGEKG